MKVIKSQIQSYDGLVYEERVVRIGDILIFETVILGEVKAANIYRKGNKNEDLFSDNKRGT